ncbi:hypothetical protein Bbelb_405840 [Branchiostoma belcheri]|nr:hypothetical protein Bbelb_405840 [Branchiostoma belcheri]
MEARSQTADYLDDQLSQTGEMASEIIKFGRDLERDYIVRASSGLSGVAKSPQSLPGTLIVFLKPWTTCDSDRCRCPSQDKSQSPTSSSSDNFNTFTITGCNDANVGKETIKGTWEIKSTTAVDSPLGTTFCTGELQELTSSGKRFPIGISPLAGPLREVSLRHRDGLVKEKRIPQVTCYHRNLCDHSKVSASQRHFANGLGERAIYSSDRLTRALAPKMLIVDAGRHRSDNPLSAPSVRLYADGWLGAVNQKVQGGILTVVVLLFFFLGT